MPNLIATLWGTSTPKATHDASSAAGAEAADKSNGQLEQEIDEPLVFDDEDSGNDYDDFEVVEDASKVRRQLKETAEIIAQKNEQLDKQREQHAHEVASYLDANEKLKAAHRKELHNSETHIARLQEANDVATKRNVDLERNNAELARSTTEMKQQIADLQRNGERNANRLRDEVEKQKQAFEKKEREFAQFQKAAQKSEEQLKATAQELERQKQENKELKSNYELTARRSTTEKNAYEKEKAAYERSFAEAAAELASLQRQLEEARAKGDREAGVGQGWHEEAKRTEAKLQETKREYDGARRELNELSVKYQTETAALTGKCANETAALNEVRAKLATAERNLVEARANGEELEAIRLSVADLEGELQAARDSLAVASNRVEEAEMKLAEERSSKEAFVRSQTDRFENQDNQNKAQIRALNAEVTNLKAASVAKDDTIASLTRQLEELQKEAVKERERLGQEKQVLNRENERLQKELEKDLVDRSVHSAKQLQAAAANAEKKARVERMFEQYPGRRPIKCHKGDSLTFSDLKRFKYAVPMSMTMEKFMGYIREKLKIEDQTVGIHLRIMSAGKVVEDADLKKTIDDYYKEYMADDGCLHIQYNSKE